MALDPRTAKAAARANEHYVQELRGAATGPVDFLRGAGLVGGPSELLWMRALLP